MTEHRNRARAITTVAALLALPALTPLRAQDQPAGVAQRRPPAVAEPPANSFMRAVRKRDPDAPKLPPEPAPESVPVRVVGKVRDLNGNPVAGATVYLLGTRIRDVPRLEIKTAVAGTA